jgi:hypothetical protein
MERNRQRDGLDERDGCEPVFVMNDEPKSGPTGLVSEIAKHLGSIYRHMLPGALVIAGARLAYRNWFCWVSLESWKHLLLLAAVSVVVGNTWFALNRYGVHQLFDLLLYYRGFRGPVPRNPVAPDFFDDLGEYTYRSLHTSPTSERARQHVEFRASSALLLLTLGEVLLLFGWRHACNSIFSGHGRCMVFGSSIPLAVGLWQMIITRRIDFYVVNPPDSAT